MLSLRGFMQQQTATYSRATPQAADSPKPSVLTVYTFSLCVPQWRLSSTGEHLQPALPTLIGIISAGLRDADRVRASALKAVEPLMFLVNSEADIVQFHGLVANMVEVRGWLTSGEPTVRALNFTKMSLVSSAEQATEVLGAEVVQSARLIRQSLL
eukprot:scaffold224288_cov15-Tisochrysis_lutea.AAC.1